jgi:PAS domain S-box-containing protein
MTPHRVTLLIVEDDLGLARLQQRRLERAGYVVHTAATAEEAAQRAGQGDIDLLILDEQLPGGVSGMELYRRMRAAGLDVPAILATGRNQEQLLLNALRAGVRDFILKTPEYLESLLPAIERVLKQVRTERQLAESREDARQALRRQRELEAEITARKRKEEALRVAEEALRVSRSRLDLVVESTNLGLWYCDLPFDELVWNDNCKRHFGLPPDARITMDVFYDRLHPDDRERTRQAIERAIHNDEHYDIEYRSFAADGGFRWIRAIGRTFFDASGKPLHFDGVTMDVTEQKRAEEMLKEADRRKDEFLAMLGHELRNPLAPIRNAVHILQLVAPSDEQVRRPLQVIDRQARQLAGLVDDLLDVSRITRGQIHLHKQTLDLATVVAQAVETSRPLLEERRHRLEVQLPPQPIFVEADPTRLAQVILNLLNNAAKYTEEGGQVWLTVTAPSPLSPRWGEGKGEGGEVRLCVRDTGMGISADMLPKIFEPFTQVEQTLDHAQGGLGIGLTLVRRLVEIHGGSVRAFSEGPGRGSEFEVRLPVATAPPSSSVNGRAEPKPTKSIHRILIVDDNKDSAESLAMLMRLLGHEVSTAHDGESGLCAATAFGPDIVLLDIGLPRLDGLEVARRLRGDLGLRDALLIAMTGYGQEEDRRRSQGAGFDAHLVKPVDFGELQALLERGAATAS